MAQMPKVSPSDYRSSLFHDGRTRLIGLRTHEACSTASKRPAAAIVTDDVAKVLDQISRRAENGVTDEERDDQHHRHEIEIQPGTGEVT